MIRNIWPEFGMSKRGGPRFARRTLSSIAQIPLSRFSTTFLTEEQLFCPNLSGFCPDYQ
jgi:hypothetical protein